MESKMSLMKLPDGQIVERSLIDSVQAVNDEFGNYVEVVLKGSKSVKISCVSPKEVELTLQSIAESFGL
jgi:hypothetical protein